MKEIEIKDISGKTRFSTPINKGAKGKFTLMKEDYILLPFSVPEPVYFKLGDYVDLSGILDDSLGGLLARVYELVDIQKPVFNTNTGGYDYTLRLDAHYWKWKNKKFKYTPEHAGYEASWSLTAPLDVQLGVFLRNLKALGYTYKGTDFQFSIDSTVENKAVAMTYDNMSLLDALFSMASKEHWNCDCWITDNIIHFGRNEYGDAVKIELGAEASAMTRSESKGTYASRIYAFGSTRNIPADYRPVDEQTVVNGVVQRRLMLPADTPCIDVYPDMSEEEAVEDIVVFDDVYPRRVGTLSDVKTVDRKVENPGEGEAETFKAYQYKDAGLVFKDEYKIEGQNLEIIFKSGKLNGLKFGVIFEPEGTSKGSQIWEIRASEDYGRLLPDELMCPENGDKYILSGFNIQLVSDQYTPEAEKELKEKAQKYAEQCRKDDGTYNTILDSVWVYEDKLKRFFEFGQKVNLINKAFFENGRESRILGWEFNLDKPWDSPCYIMGESMPYSRIGDLEDKVDSLTYKGQTYTGGGGSGVYIIRTNDSTAPSDSNVFSARRSLLSFLRKDKTDQTEFLLKLLGGAEFGEFIDSMIAGKGAGISKDGRIQAESGEFRSYLKVMELIYNRLSAIEGDFVLTESGSVDAIEDLGENTYRLTIRKRWENDFTALDTDDILRASVNNLTTSGEYYVSFYRVISKNSVDNTLTVVMYSDDACPSGRNYPPAKGMLMHRWGNTSNEKRQSCWYISSQEGRIVYLTGVTSPILTQDMYASFYGKPVNLDIFDNKPINYDEPYLYVRGLLVQDIIHVDHQGRIQYEVVDRGAWNEETANSDDPYLFEQKRESTGLYETHDVWLNSCRYRCLKSGTKLRPKWNSPDWDEISGDPTLWMDFEQPNGTEFAGEIDCPITVHVYKGVEEITDDVLDADIEWTRDTGNPDADMAWAIQHASDKKFIHITEADCPAELDLVRFTCKAFVRDNKGKIMEVENSYTIE